MDDTIKAIWGITIGAMIVVLLIAFFGKGGDPKDLLTFTQLPSSIWYD